MGDIINVYIGGSADLSKLDTLLALGEKILGKIEDIQADLAATQADLDAIKEAVTKTTTDLQAKVAELQATIDTLKAGDALTEEQLSKLVDQAEAVKVHADETLAAVTQVS